MKPSSEGGGGRSTHSATSLRTGLASSVWRSAMRATQLGSGTLRRSRTWWRRAAMSWGGGGGFRAASIGFRPSNLQTPMLNNGQLLAGKSLSPLLLCCCWGPKLMSEMNLSQEAALALQEEGNRGGGVVLRRCLTRRRRRCCEQETADFFLSFFDSLRKGKQRLLLL